MTHKMRKPRVMIAGEFSSGKTRLISALLKDEILPSNVTSTSLPPIWIKNGVGPSSLYDLYGRETEMGDLSNVSVSKTAFCEMHHNATILDHFDIIDTPGNSDPNIPAKSWMRMLDCADMIVWCTNAIQAWRQSEKAVWMEMDARLRQKAILLITHSDCIHEERSRKRLERRVRRESEAFFDEQMLVSLLDPKDVGKIEEHLVESIKDVTLGGVDSPKFDESRRRGSANIKVRKLRVADSQNTSEPVASTVDQTVSFSAGTLAVADDPVDTIEQPETELGVEQSGRSDDKFEDLTTEDAMTSKRNDVEEQSIQSFTDASAIENGVIAQVNNALKQEQDPSSPLNLGAGVSGETAAIWNRVSRGKDLTDINVLRGCVSKLIVEFDNLLETTGNTKLVAKQRNFVGE